MTNFELREHMQTLRAERAAASLEGLDHVALYIDDLQAEIEATRHALIGTAVTEIASFRARLAGPQVG